MMDFITSPLHNKNNTTLLGRYIKGVGLGLVLLIILFECFKMNGRIFNAIKCSGSFNSKSPIKSSKYNPGTTLNHPRIKATSTMFIYTAGIRPFLQDFYTYEAFIRSLGVDSLLYVPTIPSLLDWTFLHSIFLLHPNEEDQHQEIK